MDAFDKLRLEATANDLLALGANCYCDLGPGSGFMPLLIKDAGKQVVAVEAPWEFETRTLWAKDRDVPVYKAEFFYDDFANQINEPVDCFSLVHCIAHFRFSPQVVLQKVYEKLPKGGYFYLSTVNATRVEKLSLMLRGKPLTEEVCKESRNPYYEDYKRLYNPTGKYMIWDDWMHVKEYTPEELKTIFESENFKVLDLRYRNNGKLFKRDLLTTFFPQFKDEIIIIGQKQ